MQKSRSELITLQQSVEGSLKPGDTVKAYLKSARVDGKLATVQEIGTSTVKMLVRGRKKSIRVPLTTYVNWSKFKRFEPVDIIKKQDGGAINGPSHEDGGVSAVIVATEESIELEGGEGIISVVVMQDPEQKIYSGSNKEILSAMQLEHGCNPMDGANHYLKDGGTLQEESVIELRYKDKPFDGDKSALVVHLAEETLKDEGICCFTGAGYTISKNERDITFHVPANKEAAATKALEDAFRENHITDIKITHQKAVVMRKGGPVTKSQQKFDTVMHEWKAGTLHHGGTGDVVRHPGEQDIALAIAFSEARKIYPKYATKHKRKSDGGISSPKYTNGKSIKISDRVRQEGVASMLVVLTPESVPGFTTVREYMGTDYHDVPHSSLELVSRLEKREKGGEVSGKTWRVTLDNEGNIERHTIELGPNSTKEAVRVEIKKQKLLGKEKSIVEWNRQGGVVDLFGETSELPVMFVRGGPIPASLANVRNWSEIPDQWKLVKPVKKVSYELVQHNDGLKKIIAPFVSHDELRPIMTGINYDEHGIVATDAHKVIAFDKKIAKSNYGTYTFDGKKLDGKYPNWSAVIPNDNTHIYEIDFLKLKTYCEAMEKGAYPSPITHHIAFKLAKDEAMGFNSYFLIEVCDAMLKMGIRYGYMGAKRPNNAAIFASDKETAKTGISRWTGKSGKFVTLLMPVMLNDMDDSHHYGARDLDFDRESLVYFDFSKNEIMNADGKPAKFDENLKEAQTEGFTKEQLKIFGAVISKTNTLPILDYVAIIDGRAMASDLELNVSLKAPGFENGMYEIISGYPSKTELSTDEFVKMPKMEGKITTLNIDKNELEDALYNAANFVGRDELRPVMNGMHLYVDGGKIIYEATDAWKIIRKELKSVKPNGTFDVIIPRTKALHTILSNSECEIVEIEISHGEYSNTKLTCGDTIIYVRNIDGIYPDVTKILPESMKKAISLSSAIINKCLKDLSVKEKKEGAIAIGDGKLVYFESTGLTGKDDPKFKYKKDLCDLDYDITSGNFPVNKRNVIIVMPMSVGDPITEKVKNLYGLFKPANLQGAASGTKGEFDLYKNEVDKGFAIFPKAVAPQAKPVKREVEEPLPVPKDKKEATPRPPVGQTKLGLKMDKARKAKHPGKRISKDGNVYYESRPNRSDKDLRKRLEKGGDVVGIMYYELSGFSTPQAAQEYWADEIPKVREAYAIKDFDRVYEIMNATTSEEKKRIDDYLKKQKGGEIEPYYETIYQMDAEANPGNRLSESTTITDTTSHKTYVIDALLPSGLHLHDITKGFADADRKDIYVTWEELLERFDKNEIEIQSFQTHSRNALIKAMNENLMKIELDAFKSKQARRNVRAGKILEGRKNAIEAADEKQCLADSAYAKTQILKSRQ